MQRMQWLLMATAIGLLAGCGESDSDLGHDVQRSVTAAALDSVPVLAVHEGRQICEADGRATCPLHTAIANWIDDKRYVLWEPGRLVTVRSIGDTTALPLGELGTNRGQYDQALAAGVVDGRFVVVDGWRNRAVTFGANRAFQDESAVPRLPPATAIGFVGAIEVRQAIQYSSSGVATLYVWRVKSFADSIGSVLLQLPVPSLGRRPEASVAPVSLFPVFPVYTIARNGDVVWSAADRLQAERRSATGAVRWRTAIDVPPVPITPQDIAARRTELTSLPGMAQVDINTVDSAAAHTSGVFRAVGGMTLDPAGQVLLAGPIIPTRDSVDFYLLARDGAVTGRFRLEKRTQVLLLAGDSLLVHRPTQGEPWEVRWLSIDRRH